MQQTRVSPLHWGLLFFLGGIWGSSFILFKIGVRSFSTFEAASLRIFFASIWMIPFLPSIIKRYKWKVLLWMLLSALLGSGIPAILFAYSASRLDSNINGVINSLTPIFTLLVGVLWLKNKTSKLSSLGIFIGFLGILLLILIRQTTFKDTLYAFVPLIATMMYGVNMNIVKVKLAHLPAMDILKGVFGLLGLIYLPIVCYLQVFNSIDLNQIDLQFWISSSDIMIQKNSSMIALIIVGLLGSLFASWMFYILVQGTNALFASMNTYLIPLMAIFWGWVDGEAIGWMHFVSLICILCGVYLVSKKK